MLVKIHKAYRKTIAVCDVELLGKKFEEGNMQLYVNEEFYGGEKKTEDEIVKILRREKYEDSIFNLVGEKSINAGIKAGIIERECIIKIEGIPHALSLF